MPTAAPLHIVSGKGGTGKTTVALSLGRVLARRTGDVLVCEVEARHGLTAAAGVPPVELGQIRQIAVDGHRLSALSVNADNALEDYLESHFKLGLAGKLLQATGFVDFATELAPGLRDVLLIGKVYQAARWRLKGAPQAVEAVVLDAPPTGRIETFLTAGDALAEVVQSGPIWQQADSVMRLLRSPDTRVHLVTTLTEMAATETVAALQALVRHRLRPGRVVANQVLSAVPAMPDGVGRPLAEAAADAQAIVDAQQPWRDLIASTVDHLGLPPMIELPLLPPGETDSIGELTDLLEARWRQ